MRAVFNGVTLAESDETIVVEGNHYFPPDSLNREHFEQTQMRSLCIWKGMARYYTVEGKGKSNTNAAWYYPQPYPWIRKIRNHVAFMPNVKIRD